jgi:hypothetical protein
MVGQTRRGDKALHGVREIMSRRGSRVYQPSFVLSQARSVRFGGG